MGTYFKAVDRFAAALTRWVIAKRWLVVGLSHARQDLEARQAALGLDSLALRDAHRLEDGLVSQEHRFPTINGASNRNTLLLTAG